MSTDLFEWEGKHGNTRRLSVSVAGSLSGDTSIFMVVSTAKGHAAGYMPIDKAIEMAYAILDFAGVGRD